MRTAAVALAAGVGTGGHGRHGLHPVEPLAHPVQLDHDQLQRASCATLRHPCHRCLPPIPSPPPSPPCRGRRPHPTRRQAVTIATAFTVTTRAQRPVRPLHDVRAAAPIPTPAARDRLPRRRVSRASSASGMRPRPASTRSTSSSPRTSTARHTPHRHGNDAAVAHKTVLTCGTPQTATSDQTSLVRRSVLAPPRVATTCHSAGAHQAFPPCNCLCTCCRVNLHSHLLPPPLAHPRTSRERLTRRAPSCSCRLTPAAALGLRREWAQGGRRVARAAAGSSGCGHLPPRITSQRQCPRDRPASCLAATSLPLRRRRRRRRRRPVTIFLCGEPATRLARLHAPPTHSTSTACRTLSAGRLRPREADDRGAAHAL